MHLLSDERFRLHPDAGVGDVLRLHPDAEKKLSSGRRVLTLPDKRSRTYRRHRGDTA